jgi:hypothetical protein
MALPPQLLGRKSSSSLHKQAMQNFCERKSAMSLPSETGFPDVPSPPSSSDSGEGLAFFSASESSLTLSSTLARYQNEYNLEFDDNPPPVITRRRSSSFLRSREALPPGLRMRDLEKGSELRKIMERRQPQSGQLLRNGNGNDSVE